MVHLCFDMSSCLRKDQWQVVHTKVCMEEVPSYADKGL